MALPTGWGDNSGPIPNGGTVSLGGVRVGPGSVDMPYVFEFDAEKFMNVLIHAEYRPYLLTRKDNGEKQIVWAHLPNLRNYDELPDLSGYAEGEIVALPFDHTVVKRDVVVVLPKEDGGTANEHGVHKRA